MNDNMYAKTVLLTTAYERLQSAMHENMGRTKYCAERVLDILFEYSVGVSSVVDFGCGSGSWLAALKKRCGPIDILGLDGGWTDRNILEIDPRFFKATDLTRPVALSKRFDLALSVEVAEHIDVTFAHTFVESIANSSDHVVFSAAIPNQGGVGHRNEQWPDYWSRIFANYGFLCFDIFRDKLWGDEGIDWWYKQNLLFFSRNKISGLPPINNPLPLVHPDLYSTRCRKLDVDLLYKDGRGYGEYFIVTTK